MSGSHMEEFWDARAREDALFFIDNRRDYGDQDLQSFWASGEMLVDRILGMLGVRVEPDDVALDIGCGVGRLTRALAERASRVYGLDVSAEMVERARELNRDLSNVEWIHGDGTTLAPLADARISACLSHVVFQHIPDPQITYGYVREIGRVLRPGGWAAFQVSNDPGVHVAGSTRRSLGARLAALVRPARQPQGQDDPAWIGSAVDMGDLRAAAADGGLILERVEGEGTQFCMVLARRQPGPGAVQADPALADSAPAG